jgi:hypothetical protein
MAYLKIKTHSEPTICLLLKLLHRLHHPQGSSWAQWAINQINLSDLTGALVGAHWSTLRDLLPAYQQITTVSVGNGKATSFWHYTWLVQGPLALKMPALFSHFVGRSSSVHDVLRAGVRNLIQQRLSPQATEELQVLASLLNDV